MRRLVPRALVTLALLSAAAPAAAEARRVSRHLWATINACDTISHPDTIGVRGSMPGSANADQQMFMRFRVQYFRASDQRWHNIDKGGDSGFVPVGPAKYKARQAGRLFVFAPPAGGSFQLRGKVSFEWRLDAKVVHRETLVTTAGHRSSAGSDPEGYSSDTCVIS
jgi:hypothetical protein